ncbi:hypothetical protein G7046_g8510 [Stylonectria norvegica]|nr:hypothetical protein G7046_g8510 [Stylonectria norvegica]
MRMVQLAPRALALFLLSNTYAVLSAAAPGEEPWILQKPGSRGAVACESKECSEIGHRILSQGGNAVDAAIATTLCVGVVAQYHSGIGGGGFMLVRDKEGKYEAIDFRESAPAAAFKDMYKDKADLSVYGALSVAVPGELRGLAYAHKKYGSLPWKQLVDPASQLASDGFRVNSDFERYISASVVGTDRNFLVEDPAWAEDFVKDGKLIEEGSILTRKRYAETLKLIGEEGAESFYTGKLARQMIETLQKANGTMTVEDLRDYEVISRHVLNITYNNYTLFGIGSPANGAVALNILKIMEHAPRDQSQNSAMHTWVEAMKFAYGARMRLGDPDFVAETFEFEKYMLDEGQTKSIFNRIDPDSVLELKEYNPARVYSTAGHGTSHIVTADSDGMAVSLTSTVNLLFGSQLMDSESGVVFNNEMNDFSIPGKRNEFGFAPSKANYIGGRKRPLSSITPIIVEDANGVFFATVGAAGGSRIVSSTAQTLYHLLHDNKTLAEAIHEPRLHDQLLPNVVLVEKHFDVNVEASLRAKGHNIKWINEGLSAVHGIVMTGKGVFEAVAEPRQKNSGARTD